MPRGMQVEAAGRWIFQGTEINLDPNTFRRIVIRRFSGEVWPIDCGALKGE